MKALVLLLLSITLAIFSSLANADMYRCEENGAIVYRSEPCKVQGKAIVRTSDSNANKPAQAGPQINPATGMPYSASITPVLPRNPTATDIVDYMGQAGTYIAARGAEKSAERAALAAVASTNVSANDPECQFTYYVNGDDKGKQLAFNASQECVSNNALRRSGKSVAGLQQYALWRDHYQMTTNARNQALERTKSPPRQNSNYNCRPDGTGGLYCVGH